MIYYKMNTIEQPAKSYYNSIIIPQDQIMPSLYHNLPVFSPKVHIVIDKLCLFFNIIYMKSQNICFWGVNSRFGFFFH